MEPTHEGHDWIFVSDAHFTGQRPGEVEPFLSFLEEERDRIGHLVILGDLFEFFFGFKKAPSIHNSYPGKRMDFAFPGYLPVFEKLERLYRLGVRISYFEGNHDFFLGSFFSEHFGMDVDIHPGGVEKVLGEKRAYIAHGDLSNPKQWKYRLLRKVLKNGLTCRLIHFVGPSFTRRVAQRMNEMSQQRYHPHVCEKPPLAFRAFAHRKFLEGYDRVILGHSHFPEEVEEWVDGRRCLYFNVGDWLEHRSFLRFKPPDHYALDRYPG